MQAIGITLNAACLIHLCLPCKVANGVRSGRLMEQSSFSCHCYDPPPMEIPFWTAPPSMAIREDLLVVVTKLANLVQLSAFNLVSAATQ
jgi:hypothetical protein